MEKIYEILQNLRPENDFKSSEDFIAEGLLDSFDIFSLVGILEETFGITLDVTDVVQQNFESANTIAELVQKKGGKI